jgi:mono/diheme cytochrome c family protein
MTRRNTGLLALTAVMVGCLPDYPSGTYGYGGRGYGDGQRYPMSPGDGTGAAGSASGAAPRPAPEFGTTIRQSDSPPPLSGGTMAVAPDGFTVVAADPDRDVVYVLDYRASSTLRTIGLTAHDEPGRVAIDASRRAHVALRGGKAIVTIDLATAAILERRDVCSAPRGIAYDAASDAVHVACAAGELVTLPAAGGPATRRRNVARDLRDVVVVPGGLLVSTFRDAKIFRLDGDSDVAMERVMQRSPTFGTPRVAWRMIAAPPAPGSTGPTSGDDDVVVAAQKAPDSGDDGSVAAPPPPATPAEYYPNDAPDPCAAKGPGPVLRDRNEAIHVPGAVLPVDVASDGEHVVLVAAGNAHTPGGNQLIFINRVPIAAKSTFTCDLGLGRATAGAQLTSVAYAMNGTAIIALSREPAALVVFNALTHVETYRVPLSAVSREDTGHAIFHSNSGAGVACASCHPDGRDDGHAWRSLALGARRTPSLLGTLADTAPYHWNGEAADMKALMALTFQSRMHGPALVSDQNDAVDGWLRALKAPPAAKPADPAAADRGKALFEGAANCVQCHSGSMKTNNASVDVGTGGLFQVPSLVGVAWRTPLFHDGSAASLSAVLARGHGGATLQAQQKSDLAAYVATF